MRTDRERLAEHLRAREPEIAQTILTRVYSVADPTGVGNPEYVSGLRAAVVTAVRFGLSVVAEPKAASVTIPIELMAQVRSAARNRVPLETVLRRYVAGHTLLSDFVLREGRAVQLLGTDELQRLVRRQAELFDHVMDVIAAEYRAAAESGLRSPDQGRIDCVQKLLTGQIVDERKLGYELSGWHVAIAAAGPNCEQLLRDHARRYDRRHLFVSPAEEAFWAWLSGSRRPSDEELDGLFGLPWSSGARVAIGEPAREVSGWRLSHHEAIAALPVALHGGKAHVRYRDVALLAAAMQDEVLSASLRRHYLDPLAGADRDGGATLRHTLCVYFQAQRNSASAAAALGVTRQTVNNRLRAAEEHLGRALADCAAYLEVALQLKGLEPSEQSSQGVAA